MIKWEILGFLKHGDDAILDKKGNFKDDRSFETVGLDDRH